MRKGLIKITNELYVKDWDRIWIFMKDFRPTHIEFRPWEGGIWYLYGKSPKFSEIQEGEDIPQYDVIFTSHKNDYEDEHLTYEFKKL